MPFAHPTEHLSMKNSFRKSFVVALVFVATILPIASSAVAQEKEAKVMPGAPRLLPEDTFVYVRLDSARPSGRYEKIIVGQNALRPETQAASVRLLHDDQRLVRLSQRGRWCVTG